MDSEVAFAAASDETLPIEVRLTAWSQSMRELDAATEELIVQAMTADGFHPMASAAQALSSPQVDIRSIVRLLCSSQVPSEHTLKVVEYLIGDWEKFGCIGKLNELLAADGLSEEMQNLVSLYAVNAGYLSVFDSVLDRIPDMRAEMVGATVALFGHILERPRVQRAVSAIASREWSASDRISIAGSLTIGLTYRMKMTGMRSGVLEPIPPHPGRTIPFSLLEEWMARDDYEPLDHLRLTLDAMQLGVPGAANNFRPLFDAAITGLADDDYVGGSLVGRALEFLYANGMSPPLEELERLALSATYNLASSVVGVIAKGGTEIEAETLRRLYENVTSEMLRNVILGVLEPLAGRLGLRITRSDNKLTAMLI